MASSEDVSLANAVRSILEDLEEEGIEHMVVGGVALDALGVPRTTYDIDIQVSAEIQPPAWASSFLHRLVVERAHDEVFDQDVLHIHSVVNPVPVELFFTSHWFTKQALERRRTVESEVLGRPMTVPTPEDMILLKACFWQAESRSRRKGAQDGVDVEAIIRTHLGDLDLAYLEENGRRLGVWEAVAEVLEDVA